MDGGENGGGVKQHRARRAGPKAVKKKAKKKGNEHGSSKKERQRNPRAFSFKSAVSAKKLHYKTMEREERRLHVPRNDYAAATLAEEELPPYVIVVQGPPQVWY